MTDDYWGVGLKIIIPPPPHHIPGHGKPVNYTDKKKYLQLSARKFYVVNNLSACGRAVKGKLDVELSDSSTVIGSNRVWGKNVS